MARQHLLAAFIALSLSACDRPEPIEPVAGDASTPAANAGSDTAASTPPTVDLPPTTDPSTSPAPAGTTPTAPTPAGTLSTDPLPAAAAPDTDADGESRTAVVTLQPTSGSKVSGLIDLMTHDGGVHFSGRIAGLTPNAQHGFHVHETGDCSAPDASGAGGHFNPSGDAHGAHDAPSHHAGDLPSVSADAQGEADVDVMANGLEIGTGGPRDVIGRALIVHQSPDDLRTQPDGAAGPRIGCGVIVAR
jgi:superoxide dismutase, Cu-Zn family